MDLDRLRTFSAVLEHRSFSRAAQALARTQSTVSFHIRALEQELEATLLDRRRGQVRPTAAGKQLASYARRLLALADEAEARVRAEDRGATGQLRLAASSLPGEVLLPPVLARFRAAHPGVSVSVAVSDTRRALAALTGDECELALVGERVPDRRLTFTAFADDEVVLVSAPDKPWTRSRRLSADELRAAPLLSREAGSATQRATRALAASLPAPVVEIDSSEALKRCAVAGVGVAFVSRLAVAGELARGELVVLATAGTPLRRRMYAVRLRAAPLSAPARAILSMLRIQ